MKKLLLYSVVLGLALLRVHGQDVDPLTGRAIVNIPLGTVSALDLSVSVGLSHHGGALKVSESAGSAGMGWSIVAGGSISREVRGLPDEFSDANRSGWLTNGTAATMQGFSTTADDNLGVCSDEVTTWNTLNGYGAAKDTEPDMYYFQAPGISGRFVFGADGLPKLIPYQDLQITKAGSSFTIKTNTGIVYTFDQPENVSRKALQVNSSLPVNYQKDDYNYYTTPVNYVASWSLSSIESLASGAQASFSYIDGEQYVSSRYTTIIQPGSTQADTLYALNDTGTPKLLRQVMLMNYKITLQWSNALVSKVTVSESESGEQKEYNLIYKSITSSSDDFDPVIKPFLMQVKQQNSCTAYPSYLFNYTMIDTVNNTAPIPWRRAYGQDHFGYYNGKPSSKNIPTVYFYAAESGARRFRVTPIPSTTATQILSGINGTDRNVNSIFAQHGALHAIYYPTGGATYFYYEGNTYYDSSTGEELPGPGLRVASIVTSGGDYAFGRTGPIIRTSWHSMTKSYVYTASDASTMTSGRILYPPVYAFTDGTTLFRSQTDLGPGSEVLYGRIKEVLEGQGARVYTYDLPNTYPDATAAATASKIGRPSGATCTAGLLQNGAYTWPFAPLTDYQFKRGFLTRMTEFDQAGNVTREKRMIYTLPQVNTVLKGIRKEAVTDASNATAFHFSIYQIPVGQSRILQQEIAKQVGEESVADSTKITTSYVYNAKNQLTQTTRTNGDGSVLRQDMRYAGGYAITAPAAGDVQANAIFALNANSRSGQLIETFQTYTPIGGTATVTGAQLNLFKEEGGKVWPYQQKHLPAGAAFTAATIATGTTQSFVADTDYQLDITTGYASGMPVNSIGTDRIPTAVHYASGTALPLATFINCKAEQAVYDGFDLIATRGLTYTGSVPPVKVTGWTGQNAVVLNNTFALVTLNTVSKGEGQYRISLWAYATATNQTITVSAKDGATVQSTLTLTCPVANKWTYLEGTMDMSNVSATFKLEVSSTTTFQIDDFVALPKVATVALKTYLPLTGVTSQTDDRGQSTVVTYDLMGRPVNTFDKNRNLIERKEYGFQRQGKVELSANFTSNTTVYTVGNTASFTAVATCIPGVTYSWTFTTPYGVQTTASGSTVSNVFSLVGENKVTLTAASPGYGTQSFTQVICVTAGTLSLNVSVSPSATIYQCDPLDNRIRTFTATVPGLPNNGGPKVIYTWYITNINGQWINTIDVSGATANGRTLTYISPAFTYQVRCEVQFELSHPVGCGYNQFVGNGISGVTFVSQSQCP